MATIKDVAQHAGVSIATVSNYINKTKPVSRDAAARIAAAIRALQYTPNLSAKSLKSNVYNTVGVILPNLSDSYYVQIFQGIEAAFHDTGYHLNPAFSYDIPESEHKIAGDMLRKQVCGMIVVSCQPDQWKFYYENFIKQDRPLVLIDRAIRNLDTSMIRFDSRQVVQAVTGALLRGGHRRLALMAGPEQFSCETACREGFLQAFQEETDAVPTVVHIELNKEDAFRKTAGLLSREVPQGILATSELTATGIIEALHVLGYAPDQIPVITLGEEHWNKYTHSFAAFSVERPAIRIGDLAAQTLLKKIRSPQTQESEHHRVSCDLTDTLHKLQSSLSAAVPPVTVTHPPRLRVLMLDTPAVHTMQKLIQNFEKQTGVSTQVVLQPHSSLYQAILESHRDPDSWDVYMYDLPWLPMLAAGGVLQELSAQLEGLDTASLLPGCMENFSRYGAGYYGIPLMYAPQMLYYRKNLFQDPELCARYEKLYGTRLRTPRTFQEFNTVAKFFTQQTDEIPYGISLPAAYPECLAPELYMRLRAYGSDVIDRQGNVVLRNPNALKAYVNLIRAARYAKPDYMQATDVSIVEDFLRGETAMLITYPGFLTDVSDLRMNNRIGSIGCSHIPGKSPLLGGWSLGISSRSSHSREAFAFLKWACTEQMATYFSMLGCYSAVSSTYSNDELVNLYPWLPLYREVYPNTSPMLPSVSHRGQVISPNDIDRIVCRGLYRLLEQPDREIEPILSATQQELEQLLL